MSDHQSKLSAECKIRHDGNRVAALYQDGHSVLFERLFDEHRDRVEARAAKLDEFASILDGFIRFDQSVTSEHAWHKVAAAAGTTRFLRLKLARADWTKHQHTDPIILTSFQVITVATDYNRQNLAKGDEPQNQRAAGPGEGGSGFGIGSGSGSLGRGTGSGSGSGLGSR